MKRLQKCMAVIAVLAMTLVCVVAPADTYAAQKKAASLSPSKATVQVGKSVTIHIKNRPSGTKVTYTSSNKKVARVSGKGRVTAVKKGKATITVSLKKKGYNKKLRYSVTVQARKKASSTTKPATKPDTKPGDTKQDSKTDDSKQDTTPGTKTDSTSDTKTDDTKKDTSSDTKTDTKPSDQDAVKTGSTTIYIGQYADLTDYFGTETVDYHWELKAIQDGDIIEISDGADYSYDPYQIVWGRNAGKAVVEAYKWDQDLQKDVLAGRLDVTVIPNHCTGLSLSPEVGKYPSVYYDNGIKLTNTPFENAGIYEPEIGATNLDQSCQLNEVVVITGETSKVPITDPITCTSDDDSVIEVRYVTDYNDLHTGAGDMSGVSDYTGWLAIARGAGRTNVTMTCGNYSVSIPFVVRDYSGWVSPQ